jgi:hypothetical protein
MLIYFVNMRLSLSLSLSYTREHQKPEGICWNPKLTCIHGKKLVQGYRKEPVKEEARQLEVKGP